MKKSDEDWKKELPDDVYKIARQKNTEAPFTGKLNDCYVEGTYECYCCGHPLFLSEHKFDSGCGWPSYFQPVNSDAISYKDDYSLFRKRIEILCKHCDAHLGHVFEDGPEPTGQRFCVNSAVLKFNKK